MGLQSVAGSGTTSGRRIMKVARQCDRGLGEDKQTRQQHRFV